MRGYISKNPPDSGVKHVSEPHSKLAERFGEMGARLFCISNGSRRGCAAGATFSASIAGTTGHLSTDKPLVLQVHLREAAPLQGLKRPRTSEAWRATSVTVVAEGGAGLINLINLDPCFSREAI